MNRRALLIVVFFVVAAVQGLHGCAERRVPYGTEHQLALPGPRRQVWAVAPAVNLSGQREVDPILQSDLLYQQLQQVRGITAIPVNRTAEVYSSLRIDQVQSQQQAEIVCELLGCDGLLVPTITAYDPYNPPKVGASLQLFTSSGSATMTTAGVDPRELVRRAAPVPGEGLPEPEGAGFHQAVGMFDAANGSVRQDLFRYADGRNDPAGPMGPKEYLVSMDRYGGFVYHTLLERLIKTMRR